MRILGIDPGLQKTGWGIIDSEGHRLSFVACGLIKTTATKTLPERLCQLDDGMLEVLSRFKPEQAAIEETFVNSNSASSLKLGCARGVAMVVPARQGLDVGEYPANLVKKSVVGAGKAGKDQVGMMIRTLLPACGDISEDEADALAVAICHAHHAASKNLMGGIMAGAAR
ncbi:MAG: crossover junction endodeoxyribonuclease RuvC [Alphaproteobacteria bacterium]|nr:crossover junction endodeoxyribonuclease RuvC [Alphaproteobacteria bacterium]